MQIPGELQEITPAWLTAALRTWGVLKQTQVTTIAIQPLNHDQGMTSQLARLYVQYSQAEPGAPHTLIAKLPSVDPTVREICFTLTGHYAREHYFFTELADQVPTRIARCYYSALDIAARQSILLLEDLAPMQVLDSEKGCPPQAAEIAIRAIAQLHARWWAHPTLMTVAAHAIDTPGFAQQSQLLYQQAWPQFRARMENKLPAAFIEIGDRLRGQVAYVYAQLQQPPWTLLHNDFHLENMLFGPPESQTPFALIDWQFVSVGRGALDVATLLAKDLTTEERRRSEGNLLDLYLTLLKQQGVADYSSEQCWHDYRLTLLKIFIITVVAFTHAKLTAEQSRRAFQVIIPRYIAAILDHNACALLPANGVGMMA